MYIYIWLEFLSEKSNVSRTIGREEIYVFLTILVNLNILVDNLDSKPFISHR